MDEVEAPGLQVDAFPGRIGADQDAQGLLGRIGVEGLLDRLAAVAAGRTREDADALDHPVGAGEPLAQPLLEPAAGVLVLGEDDQPAVVPGVAVEAVGLDPAQEPSGAGVAATGSRAGHLQHGIDRGDLALQRLQLESLHANEGCLHDRGRVLGVELRFEAPLVLVRDVLVDHRELGREGSCSLLHGGRPLGAQTLQGLAMQGERLRKCRDRREQALLQAREDEPSLPGRLDWKGGEATLAQLLVVGEHGCELQLRRLGREAVEHDGLDHALREALAERAEIGLEPAHHDGLEIARTHLDAAGEALRVEHRQERGEAVGMAVVRRGAEEEPMLEALHDLAHRPGELAVDGIARAARRGRVMGLVEDQHRAGTELAEPHAQARRIGLVCQEAVRDDEARAGRPGIYAEAPGPAQLRQPLAIDDLEGEAELGLQLVLPLKRHRRWGRHDNEVDAAAKQQLAQDEPSLDRLSEADVVCDQKIDPRQLETWAYA